MSSRLALLSLVSSGGRIDVEDCDRSVTGTGGVEMTTSSIDRDGERRRQARRRSSTEGRERSRSGIDRVDVDTVRRRTPGRLEVEGEELAPRPLRGQWSERPRRIVDAVAHDGARIALFGTDEEASGRVDRDLRRLTRRSGVAEMRERTVRGVHRERRDAPIVERNPRGTSPVEANEARGKMVVVLRA